MEKKHIKVTLVDLWRINNAKGGTEKVFFDMADNLQQRGFQVVGLYYDTTPGKPAFYTNPEVTFQNLFPLDKGSTCSTRRNFSSLINLSFEDILYGFKPTYHRLSQVFPALRLPARWVKTILLDSKRAARFRSKINEINSDIFICFQPEATHLLISALNIKKPIITMFHMSPSLQFHRDGTSYNSSLRKCSCIQTLMPEFVEQIQKTLNSKNVVCIPNIVPQHRLINNRKSKTISFLGRFDRDQKRPHLLVQAFALLKKEFPDWEVKLYGETSIDQDYFSFIKKIIKDNSLNSQVKIMGPTDSPLLALQQSSIFVFPSAFEGFGLALTEAMSLGVACVGFKNCDAVNSLIKDHKNGLLCDSGPVGLASSLKSLMQDEELRIRIGNQAKKDMEEYSPNKVWQRWEDLIMLHTNRL